MLEPVVCNKPGHLKTKEPPEKYIKEIKMNIDNEELAKRFISYSLWWIRFGRKLHEKRNAEFRALIDKLISEGYSEKDAFYKAIKQDVLELHPDEDYADKVDEISKTGNIGALVLMKTIVELAPNDEDLLCYIGAGLFEDWIQKAKYEEFKNEIESLYETNEKWRIVIESSWCNPAELERILGRNNKKN